MSNTPWTPGPWAINRRNLRNGGRAISANDGKDPIADVYAFGDDDCHDNDAGFRALRDRCEANARLIAAAPEMAEVLRLWLAYDSSADDVSMMIRYAEALEATKALYARIRGDAP